MLVKTIAKKYAKALYEISKEQNKVEETRAALFDITSSMDRKAYEAFSNPKVTLENKVAGIEKVFAEKLSKELVNFLSLLIEKKRFTFLPEIGIEFKSIYDENHGFKAAKIKSAFSLSEEQKAKITSALEKRYKSRFLVEYSVEASLLGGMIISIGTEMYDGSLKNKLAEIGTLLLK
ncbi:MAG: ATP synthase F1 subunit delta [Candidatus Firestonebacteria bacterium RIFOXYC2_FULL_39_67]|nr:MAG: ATP synthase F1 subunit delta [Candidatus Firestonebacteria bacterium RIFOXYD2_FULL_39_29]OGF52974.1 MAG: ATP synthase F1 subunit delta [Candidatus Firestonebacteria bacterium RifOxyC12_full_39_7]OGF55527.1 MAG: ATP synthase F1 subunit delta [Candidatus Firestonebacteria bacterium RIFOXYC2_FULL_39_67]